jgi:hypothetical protein
LHTLLQTPADYPLFLQPLLILSASLPTLLALPPLPPPSNCLASATKTPILATSSPKGLGEDSGARPPTLRLLLLLPTEGERMRTASKPTPLPTWSRVRSCPTLRQWRSNRVHSIKCRNRRAEQGEGERTRLRNCRRIKRPSSLFRTTTIKFPFSAKRISTTSFLLLFPSDFPPLT